MDGHANQRTADCDVGNFLEMHACIYCVASVRCEQHSTGKAMPDLYASERREGIRTLVTALDKVEEVNSLFITDAYGTYVVVWAIVRAPAALACIVRQKVG